MFKEFRLKKPPKKIVDYPIFIIIGLLSLVWFLIRSGRKPDRIKYPCQKVAAVNSVVFLGWLTSILGTHFIYKKIKGELSWSKLVVALVSAVLVFSGVRFYRLWEKGLKPKVIWGQTGKSRVVWITDDQATTSSVYNPSAGNQAVVNRMVDEGVKSLTRTNSVSAAWSQILPCGTSCSGKKIAIKVNFNNSQRCDNYGCPVYQVVNGLLRQLVYEKGFAQENIGIYDTSRRFPSYFREGISSSFPNVLLNPDRSQGGAPCSVGESVLGASFGCWLAEADYLINMPLLRTHSGARVTLSFKNHLGSTVACSNFHNELLNPDPAINSLVRLNNHSFIKNKTVLIVIDALYGLSQGGPGGTPNLRPNSLFLAIDPVAVDSVATDYLESLGAFGSRDPRIPYRAGAQIGLGNFSTSCSNGSCNFTYQNIELARCDRYCLEVSPSPIPSLSPSPSPSPSAMPGDLNNDNQVNILDLVIVGGSFGKKQGEAGYDSRADANNSGGAIDIFDLVVVGNNFGTGIS